MRERIAAVGGKLAAGPRPGGGYRVHATIPLGVSS
jgi:signal transduction histidine kinase